MSIRSPFLFSPDVYDKEPHEVDFDEEFRKNPEFWKNEIYEYEVALLKRICSIKQMSVEEFETQRNIIREKVDLHFKKMTKKLKKNK